MENLYNEDSIQKLSPLEFTRLKTDVYLGSNENPNQLLIELITNCVDEFLIGNGSEIDITVEDDKITVIDNGQGILPNVEKNGKTVLEMVYGDINTSGKYDKSEDAVYKVSTGAFGIGCSLSNFLACWLTATTRRNGEFETVNFKDGKFESRTSGKCDKKLHGVEVSFLPDKQFFIEPHINIKQLEDWLEQKACVCPGLIFKLNNKIITSSNGLLDLVEKYKKNTIQINNNDMTFQETKERQSLDFAMSFTTKGTSEYIGFCNYSYIESGVPYTTIKSCITRVLNKWAKEQGILKEKDKNIEGNHLQEGIIVVFNLVSPNIRYDSQTKVRCTSTDDNPFINDVVSSHLEVWLDNNPADGKAIIEKALIERKAAEAAKRARENVRKKSSSAGVIRQKNINMPSKLSDCYSTSREKCELIITEGDSASGNLKAVRDKEFQAVLGVKGKVLNTQKATLEKAMANAEIMDLIRALGFQPNKGDKKLDYKKSKVRYGRVIIMTDADQDGDHIQNLLYAFFWNFLPEMFQDGLVYVGVPPLFRLKNNKEIIYLKDDSALQQFKESHNIAQYQISRLKGLGELDAIETKECLLDPDNRIVKQVSVKDMEEVSKLFNILLGSESLARKKFIQENAEKAEIYV